MSIDDLSWRIFFVQGIIMALTASRFRSGKKMKAYPNSIKAIRDHLAWLDSQGKLDLGELERQQVRAGLSTDEIISAEMMRLFRRGKVKSFSAERAEAFCRVVGIQLSIISNEIPESFVGSPES